MAYTKDGLVRKGVWSIAATKCITRITTTATTATTTTTTTKSSNRGRVRIDRAEAAGSGGETRVRGWVT